MFVGYCEAADVKGVAVVVIDSTKHERCRSELELGEPVVDLLLDDVAFVASLGGSTAADFDHASEPCRALPSGLETCVRMVDMRLFGCQLRVSTLSGLSLFQCRNCVVGKDQSYLWLNTNPNSRLPSTRRGRLFLQADSVLIRMTSRLGPDHPAHRLADSAYLLACRGEAASHVPVWFQRQAGRSLPEYMALRREGSILDTLRLPDVSAEITLQPIRRYGVDAAILYSDIVVPAECIGFGVDVKPGVGPVIDQPFRSRADLERLRPLEPNIDTAHVLETIRIVVGELDVPLIGFAGAPFTVASYLIEGRPSRDYANTKALMLEDVSLWHDLMERLADLAIVSIRSQVEAGASALQLFDSWAGALSPSPTIASTCSRTAAGCCPKWQISASRVHTSGSERASCSTSSPRPVPMSLASIGEFPSMRRAGEPAEASPFRATSTPAVCLASWPHVAERVRAVLDSNAGHPGHVFNLGHGVLPQTDPGILERVVELVHAEGKTNGG